MVRLHSVDQGHFVFKRAIEPSLPAQESAPEDSSSPFAGDGLFSFANGESQSVSEAFPSATAEKPSSSTHASSVAESSIASSTSSPTSSSSSSSSTTSTSSSSGLSSASPTSTDSLTPSASASAAAADDANSSETLSGGAIAAIVAMVVIVLLGIISYLIVRHRVKRKGMANNRLTRFSMGPTYNATTGLGGEQRQPEPFGYSTAMNNNPPPPPMSSSTYNDPFQPSPSIQSQQPAYSPPMQQQQYTAPIADSLMGAGAIAAAGSMQQQQQQYLNTTMATMGGNNQQQQQQQIHTIVAGYTPALSDEIQVHPGDQVQIIAEYDDGWCLGMNLTRGQQQGVFPRHCFSPPEPSSQTAVAQQLTYPTPNFLGDPLSATAAHQKRASSLYGPLQATPLTR